MTQNASPTDLMQDFFASLGFDRVKIDRIQRDQLMDLLVTGLKNSTPTSMQERETVRLLIERLELLKANEGSGVAMPEVPRSIVEVDPIDEAQLQASIHASRDRVMREIDNEPPLKKAS